MRRALAVLVAVNVLNIYDRTALSPILEPIRREFGIGDAQLGALMTSFIIVYALAGVPLGRMADLGSRRKLLAGGIGLWTALTAAGGLAPSYSILLLSRLGVGVGEAVCAPAATSWIGDAVPPDRRSRALAIFMMGVPVGQLLSFAVSGPLAEVYGWRAALFVAAAPGLVLVPAVLGLRDPLRKTPPSSAASPLTLLRSPTFRWIIASGALLNFNVYVISAFLPSLMIRWHGWSIGEAGVWTGIALCAAGLSGGAAAAAFGDRRARRHRAARMALAAMLAAAAAPLSLGGILVPAGAVAALPLLAAAYSMLSTYYGLVYAAIQDVAPPHLRATAMSIYFLGMYLCGGAFGPMLTGGLSDTLARRAMAGGLTADAARAQGLHDAMLVIPILSLALALVLWAASRTMTGEVTAAD